MTRARLALLWGLPLAILAAGEMGAAAARRTSAATARHALEERARRLERDFRRLVTDAESVAECVRASFRGGVGTCDPGGLERRVEGTGLVDASGSLSQWTGTPSDPPADPRIRVSVRGLRASLVVRSRGGIDGISGLASFTLDAPSLGLPFASLLPGAFRQDGDRVEFGGAGGGPAPTVEGPSVVATLDTAGGVVLGRAFLSEPPPDGLAATRSRTGRSVAAVTLVLLATALLPWRRLVRSSGGCALSIVAVASGRALLAFAMATERLLPRSIASASVFGSAAAWGLLGSPAAFLLTSLAFLLVTALARSLVLRWAPRRRALATVAVVVLALAGTAAIDGLAEVLSRDARVPVLRLAAALESAGHLLILLGLVAFLFGVALLWGAVIRVRRTVDPPGLGSWGKVETGALIGVALLASVALARHSDRLAIERLRSEILPQVINQTAQRLVALRSAVAESAIDPRTGRALLDTRSGPSDAAWSLWISGDLFRRGFLSSLDLLDASGSRRSHFAFGLPPLVDSRPPKDAFDVRAEDFPFGAETRRLWHAEAPVVSGGSTIGWVVGHVLEEPENLPFLPGVAPYLAALGPGGARGTGTSSDSVEYVLYDKTGPVVHTVGQPPAETPDLHARSGSSVRVESGGTSYVGLSIADPRGLHLLLVPRRSLLDELGGFVRLALLALGVLTSCGLLATSRRPGGSARLRRGLGGSFYGKLLASLLAASILPLVGLAVFVRGYVERRAEASLHDTAAATADVVRRVVEDYAAEVEDPSGEGPVINDTILAWLRRVVGQEIHLYVDGRLSATSKPELFDSGILSPRLAGEVDADLIRGGRPVAVRNEWMGASVVPVAYARVALPGADRKAVLSVPLVVEQQEVRRSVGRVVDVLLLATALLAVVLTTGAAWLAGTVARPVAALVAATRRIATGDYGARIRPTSRDEVAVLVEAFNGMADSLARQRQDLERRRDYMEALLAHATTGVVSTDADGRIVTVNPAASRLLEFDSRSELVGRSLPELVGATARLEPLARVVSERGAAGSGPFDVDLGRAGAPRNVQAVRVPLPDPTGGPEGTLWLLDDVTDLTRSHQLSAWAEMARAIAHEIKNPLTPIQLSAEHLGRLLAEHGDAPDPEVRACLETILKQVRALRGIAGEFSTYAKLPALTPETIDAGRFLAEVVAPYRAAPPPSVEIREDYGAAPAVAIDRRVMSRAVVNLIENALQAMPSGGILTIRTGIESGAAVLTVEDTGPGLDPEVRRRLFEPYFSTKNSGTGLGLAIARRAVEAHGGTISVDAGRARGTSFRITLPGVRSA